jgi:hypothetical protein
MRTLFRLLAAVWVAVLLSSCATTRSGSPTTRSPSVLSDSLLATLDPLLPPSGARKDKRRVHLTVYNAPAKVKGGSTAVVGDGNVTVAAPQAGPAWWVFGVVFAAGALAGFAGTVAYLVRRAWA